MVRFRKDEGRDVDKMVEPNGERAADRISAYNGSDDGAGAQEASFFDLLA